MREYASSASLSCAGGCDAARWSSRERPNHPTIAPPRCVLGVTSKQEPAQLSPQRSPQRSPCSTLCLQESTLRYINTAGGNITVCASVYHSASDTVRLIAALAAWRAACYATGCALCCAPFIRRGTVAQWQSRGLLSLWSRVQIPPVPPAAPRLKPRSRATCGSPQRPPSRPPERRALRMRSRIPQARLGPS